MKILKFAAIAALVTFMVSACNKAKTMDDLNISDKLEASIDSVSYGLGVDIATNIKSQGVDDINPALLAKAMADVFAGKDLKIKKEDAGPLLQNHFQKKYEQKMEKNLTEGQAYLEKNKAEKDVVTLASGLQYKVIKQGTGAMPKATDAVSVHYHGTLINGTVFDSSVDRGEPASFPVNGVIPGWTEALQLMPVGSKWMLYIPTELAYGKNVRGGGAIEPNMALIFEVELLSIDIAPKQ